MKRFHVMKVVIVAVSALNFSVHHTKGQIPARDNFNIIFENNFEDNTPGRYVHTEYLDDWNLPSSSSMHDKEIIDIKKDADPLRNKHMRGYYPKGTFGPDQQGFLWRSYFSPYITEVYFSYDVRFKPDFEWVMGGKLPGVTGGKVAAGIAPGPEDGFSARIMWKENGRFVFYVYHQDQQQTYGNSYYIQNFNCISGKWYNITFRVVLNTINNGIAANNGILEGYIDGKLMFQKTDFKFRSLSSIKIDNMYISSFFGGGTDAWAAARDEWIDFDNFVSYTYSSSAINVPRNNTKSSTTKVLLHPYYSFGSTNTPSTPSAPTAFMSNTQTTSTINITWIDNSTNEQGFQVERSTVPNSNFEPIATIAANANAYTDTGLDPDRMYYYRIKAFNATGSSSYATIQQATSPVLPTNAEKAGFTEVFTNASGAVNRRALPVTMQESGTISSISIFHNGGTGNALLGIYSTSETLPGQRIAITSQTPVNPSAGWQTFKLTTPVEVSKGSTIWLAWVFENGISLRYAAGEPGRAQSAETYTDGMPESFGASAVSASIYSIYANYVPTQTIAQIPDAPSNLHVIQSDQNSATIGWNDNAQNETGFEIERINPADNNRKTLTAASNNISFTDNSLTENTTYQYRVRAFNSNGTSYWTNLLSVSTPEKDIEIPVVHSNKVYIDPGNNGDPLANGSEDHPYDSWSDVVWKTGYTYLQKRGTSTTADKILIGANRVTLGAYGEGELPVIKSNTNTYLISGFEKAGITISQLNLQAPNAVSSIYFLGNTSDSIIVEHCQLNANVNAIKVANGNKLVVRYNTISSNLEGVYSSATYNQIYYNIFKNCQEGINVMGNIATARIYNNVFYNNDESLSVTYADLTLFNNIFYMNSPDQKALSIGSGKLQSNNNIYYPEQSGFITIANTVYNSLQQLQQALNVDMNSFITDPVFVDMYNDNFLLAKNSPAINSGIDLNLGLDILGSNVPLSGAADIGVHEFTGIIAPREDAGIHSLRLYPNPSNGKFNVLAEIPKESSDQDSETGQIRVIDLTGKTVFARQLEQVNETTYHDQIDLTGIANGMYMVVVEMAGKLVKEKLLINR